jgi:hypothetical protein
MNLFSFKTNFEQNIKSLLCDKVNLAFEQVQFNNINFKVPKAAGNKLRIVFDCDACK